MLIDNRYADNKVYRAVKHFDTMPLTSGDLHEQFDTEYMKNAYIMDNLLGYGTLNTPQVSTTSGLRLSEPSVVMIEGDVALIQSDDNVPLVSSQDIQTAGYPEGIVCILGWYQYLSAVNILRNYGGVDNSEIPNDLKDDRFPLPISARYQLRWFPVIISKEDYLSGYVTIEIEDRDRDGNKLGTTSTITSKSVKNSVLLFDKPDTMSYSESDMYLVPIIDYTYSTRVEFAQAHPKLSAGSPFIKNESEPTGSYSDGTTWFNPTTREFKTYVDGSFVSSASKMAFLQYQSIYKVEEEIKTPQSITIPVNVSSFQEGDILRVSYEGLELAKDLNYTINYEDSTITLLDFVTDVGDTIYFTVTRVVEANDITNVTETFVSHMNSTGSSTVEAHVKLSDTLSTSDSTKGVAATPKMVNTLKSELTDSLNEANKKINDLSKSLNIVTDDSTGVKYKLGVRDGTIYLEQV